MVATGVASAAILIIGLGYGPETSIKVLIDAPWTCPSVTCVKLPMPIDNYL